MRRSMKSTVLTAALFCLTYLAASAQGNFYIHDGDRVVFYGDSITDQRLYTTFVESYVVTRFPKMDVRFVHSGWGGDRVTGGGGGPIDVRLRRDVFPYKPTVMTVMLGMNDGSYRAFDQNIFNTYSTGYEKIVQSVKSMVPGIRMTLIQPSPFDDVTRAPTFEGGYNAVLVRYGQFVKDLAQKNTLDVADLNTSVVEALKKANETDAANAQRIVPDRVHPGPGGHLLMAEALLKAWNAPSTVSAVEIDAAGKRVVSTTNSHVADLRADGNTLAWTQTDGSLPLWLDMNDAALALSVRSSDIVDALNQQPLVVKGLTAAQYTLKIDGETVGTFTKDQLAGGVNLATLPTPMLKQAQQVHMLTLQHNNIHFNRWRQLQVPMQNSGLPSLQKAMDALDALEADIVAQQRAAAQPKARRFELTAQ
jgi:lysophospholipase L1-like esterase